MDIEEVKALVDQATTAWTKAKAKPYIELLKDPTRSSPEYNRALNAVERSLTHLRAVCQDLGV